MKVLYFLHSLVVGGAETVCTKYLLALKERKVDVVLVVINHTDSFLEKQLRQSGVRIISICPLSTRYKLFSKLNGLYLRVISFSAWWNKIIEIEKPDVIHINTLLINLFVTDKFPCSKMIYTFHGDVERYMSLMNKKAKVNIQRYADGGMKFFALSNEIIVDVKNVLSTSNIAYIPNGVEIDNIRSSGYKREAFLSPLNIPMDSFVIGHVARFHEVKNQERTVKIFKEVLKTRPDSYLIFVGDCNNKWGDIVKELVEKNGLCERVRFLGIRSDATNIMAVFNAIILPSYTESFSLVMVEAQANNVRTVASMAVPESVICNDNCFRLSLDDSDETWAYYITSDFTEKNRYKLEDFAMDNVVDKLLDEYRKTAAL